MTQTLFSSLPLPKALLSNIESLGYSQMTPIQQQSLPHALKEKDLIAKAKTGSGKTAAFAITLLTKLQVRDFGCQALVLCPTRELAAQVATEVRKLARYRQNIKVVTLCGGQPIGPQIGSLAHGGHVVIGTPGRIQDHLRKQTLSLEKVNTVVLDEADRMLDMGFRDSIETILGYTPKKRQTLLFSATYPKEIKALSKDIQNNPIEVTVESTHSHSQIQQLFYCAENKSKPETLLKLLNHYQPESTVIFCNTKQVCKEVGSWLYENGHRALVLHGDLEQKERDQILVRFANNSSTLLVATDVAARGLDIDDLAAVINYDLSRDPEVHVHRIGRTGRAGKEGLALSLHTSREQYKLDEISDYMQSELSFADTRQLRDKVSAPPKAPMVTLSIDGGKKNKVRPGDILGALTGEAGIPGNQVGKIAIFDFVSYVAIKRDSARQALNQLERGKIKGRKFKVRRLG
ncbi:ATP-dependent RNA helicase DbpA [Endozoicomonas sp. Mp262]|uniref:ATP-dependent RNA helicase DbpA n=1 Tax=Endozoicomonas sp. Mp262 TaxID=2919499 RepID=UPI0021D8911B